jgi:Fe-S oxidoreductase
MLDIKIMHHTQYLLELAQERKIRLEPIAGRVAYHDPCELSRDLRVYEEPRQLLSKMTKLTKVEFEKDDTLCCGNSLANFSAGNDLRQLVARDACEKLTAQGAQYLVTSCPMCKKAFEKVAGVPVKDVAEIVGMALHKRQHRVSTGSLKAHPAEALTLQ